MNEMSVVFPGGKKVDVLYQDYRIETDQKTADGEPGEAPEPFDLFIASIAACAGIYALIFCQKRDLSTDGLALKVTRSIDKEKRRVAALNFELTLPSGFPEKYQSAILKAMDQCTVKKHILEPPEFDFSVVPGK